MGPLHMEAASGSFDESQLPGNQGRVAFAALVLERRAIGRDQLAEMVWDEHPPAQWGGALSAVVSKVRTLVSSIGLDGRAVVSSSGGTYRLDLPPTSWVDAEDALRRLDRAEGALRHDDAGAAVADATVASSILRRPFLPGVDGLWVESIRRRQVDAAHRSYVALADGWLRLDNPGLAVVMADQALAVDPLREVGHRLLMEAEWRRGERASALRAFERCVILFEEELGVVPSPETSELADAIRTAT